MSPPAPGQAAQHGHPVRTSGRRRQETTGPSGSPILKSYLQNMKQESPMSARDAAVLRECPACTPGSQQDSEHLSRRLLET